MESYLLIYALATADYRGGAATGHPEFSSQARCEAAAERMRKEVAAHNSDKNRGFGATDMRFKNAIIFCMPK